MGQSGVPSEGCGIMFRAQPGAQGSDGSLVINLMFFFKKKLYHHRKVNPISNTVSWPKMKDYSEF